MSAKPKLPDRYRCRHNVRRGEACIFCRLDWAIAALRPFAEHHEKHSDPIGDSDLYDEQPRTVQVTLGDLRRAARALAAATR